MQDDGQNAAKKFIGQVTALDRCEWCGRDGGKIHNGLCSHCNDIRKSLEKLERKVAELDGQSESTLTVLRLRRELAIAEEKRKLCKTWGQMLDAILAAPVEPLALERSWFLPVQVKLTKDDQANYRREDVLKAAFTPDQRQVLAYLLWEILSAEARLYRRNKAEGDVDRERRMRTEDVQGTD
jgi:hypothetical protein